MKLSKTALPLMLILMLSLLGCPDGGTEDAQDAASTESNSGPADIVDDIEESAPVAVPDTITEEPEPTDVTEPDAAGGCQSNTDCPTDDLLPCEIPVCNTATGVCEVGAAKDGDPCDDGNDCTLEDSCVAGACTGGEAVDCDDNNPCTDDSCVPPNGCANEPNESACDDGDGCTEADTCSSGVCSGAPIECDDGDPCTLDACEEGECVTSPDDGAPCDDGNACTGEDFCQNGECMAGDPICETCTTDDECASDDNLCNGVEGCFQGYCQPDPESIVECPPVGATCMSNPTCQPETGECLSEPLEAGAACEDGDPCTVGDSCDEMGMCVPGQENSNCTPGCEASTLPGCGGCECEECVCDIDSFCCETQWDSSCVTFCSEDCGMDCGTTTMGPDAGCQEFPTPGCGGCGCEECVCAIDSFCCESSWDGICVTTCDESCGGNCTGGGPTTTGGGTTAGCVTSDFPGCGGCFCEECVCSQDSFCCSTAWDSLCVDSCINECGGCEPCDPVCDGKECGSDGCIGSCGECGDDESCYDFQCEVHCGNGTCELELGETCLTCSADCNECEYSNGCESLEQATCGGCACEECVCELDSACCDVMWDADCVSSCVLDCGGCEYDAGCSVSEDAGCDGCECEECVCELDEYCCDTQWDELCAMECQEDCGVACDLEPCTSDLDCFDGDSCTDDLCDIESGLCENFPSESCCWEDADCDDGDDCTDDTCGEDGQCVSLAAASEDCCPDDGVVWSVDFEGEIDLQVDNSSEFGGWQMQKEISHSETHAMWYGGASTGDLNFGSSNGSLTSGAITLPPSYSLTLSMWLWTGQTNTLSLTVTSDNGDEEQSTIEPSGLSEWEEFTVDITSFGGNAITVELSFSSSGGTTAGVYLDDLLIESDCVFPVCGDGVCNGDEHCYTCGEDCMMPDECPENTGCKYWDWPGCNGCECEETVCAELPECCDTAWTSACVSLCSEVAEGLCAPPEGCEPLDQVGCNGCECEECVCANDSFCCSTSWDSLCASQCQDPCGVLCDPNFSPECGDKFCGSNEDCTTCAEDCGDCIPGCAPIDDAAGCGGCECESCVCNLDSFCCDVYWDWNCSALCADECGMDCP